MRTHKPTSPHTTTPSQYSSDSFGGAVWAACLRASNEGNGKELALACEDGSVRLFDAEEDYQVYFCVFMLLRAVLKRRWSL